MAISYIEIDGVLYELPSGGGGTSDYSALTNKPQINGTTLSGNKTSSDLGLASTSDIPTKVSDLTNDSGFITNTVNNLTNYYKKTETYTQAEVDALIGAISTISFEIVQTLPTTNIKTNVIYLVPKSTAQTSNTYDEYINTTGTSAGWEKIGDTAIDLSGYYKTSDTAETDLADGDYVPFYDTSATAKKKTLWSNIKAKLKAYFDGIYVTSSGTVAKANQLTTARSITLGNDFVGDTPTFDGSANITVSGAFYNANCSSGNTANYPWHRIAKVEGQTGQWVDKEALLLIRGGFSGGSLGLIKIALRTNATGNACTVSAKWLYRYSLDENDVVIAHWGTTGQSVYADVFLKRGQYARTVVYQVVGSRSFTLVASSEANDTTASDKKTSYEVYKTIASAATEIHSKAYTSTVEATDGGSVNYAKTAGSAPASDVYAWAKAATKPTYTSSEVGLGNVPNVTTNNQTPTFTEASSRANIASGETLSTIFGKIKKFFTDLKAVAFSGNISDVTINANIDMSDHFVSGAYNAYNFAIGYDGLEFQDGSNITNIWASGVGSNNRYKSWADIILGGGGGLSATTLWTNPSPASSFTEQEVALSQALTNFNYYEVIYRVNTSQTRVLSTGLIPTDWKAYLQVTAAKNYRRLVNDPSDTSHMKFSKCGYWNTYGASEESTANNYAVPYKIIGFK